jgi:hypothetical protein
METFGIHGSLHVRTKTVAWEPGERMEGHAHAFDHLTILAGGFWRLKQAARILRDDGSPLLDEYGEQLWREIANREVDATVGFMINIPQEHRHSFELLRGRGRHFCIYPSRDPDTGEVVQHYNFWEGASA